MNWNIPTDMPRLAARRSRPRAAVVLPLPSPVWTMSNPWRCSRGGTRREDGRFCFGRGTLRPSSSGGARGSVRLAMYESSPQDGVLWFGSDGHADPAWEAERRAVTYWDSCRASVQQAIVRVARYALDSHV